MAALPPFPMPSRASRSARSSSRCSPLPIPCLAPGSRSSLAAGTLVALLIHAWYDRHPSDIPTPAEPQRRPPQINFSSTEVAGNIGGLIFVVGSVFIVTLGLPSVIWFLFAGTIAGCFLAWALVAWHTSHPKRRPAGESDRLALSSACRRAARGHSR